MWDGAYPINTEFDRWTGPLVWNTKALKEAYGPLAADCKHLVDLGTGRWVNWAIGWIRGITRLLVEVDPAKRRSTEFVSLDHMSEEGANRRIS